MLNSVWRKLYVPIALSFSCHIYAQEDSDVKPDRVLSSSLEERLYFDGYESPIWTSHDFVGSVHRAFGGNWLWAKVQQSSKGGMDTGVSLDSARQAVDDLEPNYVSHGSIEFRQVTPEARWWYGPKVSVGWNTEGDSDGSAGWYENYIIDVAARPPEYYDALLQGDFFQGELVAITEQDGSVYKHYRVPFREWTQYWAIRQEYRFSGWTQVARILQVWRQHGLPNKRLDGIKYNIETHEPQSLEFVMSHVEQGLLSEAAAGR